MTIQEVAEKSPKYFTKSEDNTVPVGYKQTEIGMIPLEWQLIELRDVCSKIQDGNYGALYPKASEFIVYGIPFITSKVLGKAGNINLDKIDYISNEKHQILLKAHLELNDVLFTNRGASVGAIGYVDARISNGNIGPQLTLLRANHLVDSRYLFQIMKSSWVQKQISSQDSGSAMNFFGVGTTGKFKLPIPDNLKEQRSIATALSDVDALIGELEKLITKKQAIKTATMQQLLTGRTRLPQFALREDGSKKGYKPSELGEIPEGWEEFTLSELCDVRDGTHDSPKYHDVGIPLVTSKNIVNDKLDFSSISFISTDDAYEINKRSKVDCGDIIMSMIGTIGSAILIEIEPNFCIKNVALFKPRKNIGKFLIQFMRSNIFQAYLKDGLDGGIQKFISLGTLRTLKIAIPKCEEEQSSIATILSDMDEELQILEQRLNKTRQIKQGMMQELLTGKIRLVKPEGDHHGSA